METGKTVFLGCFENENFFKLNIHAEAFMKNEKIYFCPGKGRHIHIYDLSNQNIYSIEIRKKSENFFAKDVVLEQDFVYFIPDEKTLMPRKLDLKSLKISEETYRFEKRIPLKPKLLEKMFSYWPYWKQFQDKIWYGFYPKGCKLMRYREEMKEIEAVPLIIENNLRLQKYLMIVRKEFSVKKVNIKRISENIVDFQEFLDEFITVNKNKCKNINDTIIGEKIWEFIKI